jgi:hypothetical protein
MYAASIYHHYRPKKAYQIGVRKIIYIDEYEELAINQPLNVGVKPVEVQPLQGATGSAFFRLFFLPSPRRRT